MIKFVCVKWGTLYGPEYVNILFDMVRRNLSDGIEGEFVCFTDDPTGLDEGIKTRELPGNLKGWWNKLYLFKRGLFNDGDLIIYMDLDTIITGPIDFLTEYKGIFAILRDFYRNNGLQSSVMLWGPNMFNHIWEWFEQENFPDIEGGDQAWIEKCCMFSKGDWLIPFAAMTRLQVDILQDVFKDRFVSYKVHAKYDVPNGASVVVFHGHPRPHEVVSGWVPHIWKIGGGTALEIVNQANVSELEMVANIKHAISLDLPWLKKEKANEKHAVIVGGGPSAENYVEEIRARAANGQTIIALNGSWKWLLAHGIAPDWHVLLDARKENADFIAEGWSIKCFYASQCDKSVFEKGTNVTLWHHLSAAHFVKGDSRGDFVVGGGSTVGLNAIAIAYLQGYRAIHLYGFDSSYAGIYHHAYPQDLNNNERIIDVICGGEHFKCAPWMAEQAEQFRELAPQLCTMGCEITVHGEGLLPHCAATMGEPHSTDEIVDIDGLHWPANDKMARPYILGTFGDIAHIMEFVHKRDVCIQAGGHVGVWPKELSNYFSTVYTFEPDPVNFRCLNLNCTEKNIIKLQAVLGVSGAEPVELHRDTGNSGAHYVHNAGALPVVSIDDLSLWKNGCDLIQLDVEGMELDALKGAAITIEKCRPVIVVEEKGLGEKYGHQDGDIAKWLSQYGYKIISRIHRDIIFVSQQLN